MHEVSKNHDGLIRAGYAWLPDKGYYERHRDGQVDQVRVFRGIDVSCIDIGSAKRVGEEIRVRQLQTRKFLTPKVLHEFADWLDSIQRYSLGRK